MPSHKKTSRRCVRFFKALRRESKFTVLAVLAFILSNLQTLALKSENRHDLKLKLSHYSENPQSDDESKAAWVEGWQAASFQERQCSNQTIQ